MCLEEYKEVLRRVLRLCACVCRELLQRDEAILRQLLQQELKKRESLKAAESKVAKLREQLQASEKIAGANRTLLKKLQEQVGVGFVPSSSSSPLRMA